MFQPLSQGHESRLSTNGRATRDLVAENASQGGEPYAGIHYMNWRTGKQILTPDTGEPSIAIQAFCAPVHLYR